MKSVPDSTPVLKISALFCHYQVLIAQCVVVLFKHAILRTFSFPINVILGRLTYGINLNLSEENVEKTLNII
jgi:hypothetical protein